MMRRYPICWDCEKEVSDDPIFESICGHEDCPSAVFHGLCLMRWREQREIANRIVKAFIESHPMFRRED